MIGKIVEFDKNTQIGYILGFDDLTYFFKKRDVNDGIELEKDDIVDFDCLLYSDEIPTAVRIEKKE